MTTQQSMTRADSTAAIRNESGSSNTLRNIGIAAGAFVGVSAIAVGAMSWMDAKDRKRAKKAAKKARKAGR